METAIDRLKMFAAWAKEQGYVKGENSFEAYCGLSNRYIYQIKNSGSGSIGSDKIALVANKFPMLNVRWLCTGKGKMITSENFTEEAYDVLFHTKEIEKILMRFYEK